MANSNWQSAIPKDSQLPPQQQGFLGFLLAGDLRHGLKCSLFILKLLADLQEISPSPNSTGVPKSSLSRRYDEKGLVEVDGLNEKWHIKGHNSPYAPQVPKVEARVRSARRHLLTLARKAIEAGKDDAHIVVITHGEFAHWLTDDFQGAFIGTNMDTTVDYSEEQKNSLDDLPEFMWDYGGKLRLTIEEWQEAKNGYTDSEILTAVREARWKGRIKDPQLRGRAYGKKSLRS
ncbi:hypothetical protein F5Y00DRAFT_256659 [Daldinia vernicosa]|uniref:uncharacterized protein n=1 Tax=Daldinia vernicosa TaxID=114800 RepID=UPI002007CA6F|nr:uncharacterized protein F5Y00DRAFT_256659 [Daldinia vernicosa]KAI0854161.1 hypothetical protein F5Y00DRAFT_256659 [Daldinia vernicosa]